MHSALKGVPAGLSGAGSSFSDSQFLEAAYPGYFCLINDSCDMVNIFRDNGADICIHL